MKTISVIRPPLPLYLASQVTTRVKKITSRDIKSILNAFLCTFTLIIAFSAAAAPVQSWAKRYNVGSGEDRAVGVAYDPAGNVYVTGYSQNGFNSGVSSYDWATVKYGPTGNQLWAKTYNGLGQKGEKPAAIAVDGSGRVYVTGSSSATNGYTDIATIKYDTNGNVLWTKTYNNPNYNGGDYATALAVDSIGNVYVTGVSQGGVGFLEDYVTIKYNASGVQQWVKRYNSPYKYYDLATAIAVDGSGNVYVTGYSWYSAITRYDYVTVKYDAIGNQKWVNRYTGIDSTNSQDDRARAIAIDKDGNVIVTGQSSSYNTNLSGDYATVKYNSAGTQLWVKRFNGSANREDDAKDLAVDAAGNIYVTGSSISSATATQLGGPAYATVKYSPAGSQLWVGLYRGPTSVVNPVARANAIALDKTGNVYVTGMAWIDSNRQWDYATVKYNTSGVQQWVMAYNGLVTIYSQYDEPAAIAVDSANNVFVTGYSDGGSTFYDYATVKYSQP